MGISDEHERGSELLEPEDLALMAIIQHGNEWWRVLLCTLARRGVSFRHEHPGRCEQILQLLSPFPFYKAGQLMFDLFDVEDFMLDGSESDILPRNLYGHLVHQLANIRDMVSLYLGAEISSVHFNSSSATVPDSPVQSDTLPPLESGFYLYQDVVLGLISSALPNKTVCLNFSTGRTKPSMDELELPFERNGFKIHAQTASVLPIVGLGPPEGEPKLQLPLAGVIIDLPFSVNRAVIRVVTYSSQPLEVTAIEKQGGLVTREETSGENDVLHTLVVEGSHISCIVLESGSQRDLLYSICIDPVSATSVEKE